MGRPMSRPGPTFETKLGPGQSPTWAMKVGSKLTHLVNWVGLDWAKSGFLPIVWINYGKLQAFIS